jgi:hypothetical protein
MFEAYSIGVRISLINHASAGLAALSRAFIKTEGDAAKLEARIKGIKTGFLTGGLLVGAGVGLASMFEPAIKSAVRYEQQLNKLRGLNLGIAKTAALTRQADSIASNVKGTSRTDAMRMVTETQSITGNAQHTMELVPLLAKMRYGIETYMAGGGKGGGHGGAAESQFRDVIKVMELRGLMRNFSQDNAKVMTDLFTKTFIASGGQVKPSDFLAMLKTGGVAGKTVNNDFMFALGHMMQESGGHRTGTALMSSYQNLVAARTTQQVAEYLQSMGMLNPGAVHYGKTGHMTKLSPGALLDFQKLQDNPLNYLNTVILPKLAAHGVNVNDQKQVLPALNRMLSNRTASNFFSQMYMDRQVLGNYMVQAKNAKGVDALYAQGSKSTQGNVIDLTAKYDSLMTNLGQVALPIVNAALTLLIPAVKGLSDWMLANKGATKLLVIGFIGLAGALMFSGTIILLTSAFRALGLALMFGKLGGFAGIIKTASAMGTLGKALMFSQVGGIKGIMAAGKSLGFVATGLGLLMQAAAVFAAAYAGWKIGGLIYNKAIAGTSYGDAIGGTATNFMAAIGNKDAQATVARMKSNQSREAMIGPRGRNAGMVHTTVNIDGRKVAEAVTPHQTKAATRAQTGTSHFDATQFATPVGISGSW